jgi:hypothetical protein
MLSIELSLVLNAVITRSQYALWGNKTDLSMLVDVAHMDTAALAAAVTAGSGSSSSSSSNANVIVDEFDAMWEHLKVAAQQQQQQQQDLGGSSQGLTTGVRRIDVILDNAGLELYTDLWLADFLVSSGFCDEVMTVTNNISVRISFPAINNTMVMFVDSRSCTRSVTIQLHVWWCYLEAAALQWIV